MNYQTIKKIRNRNNQIKYKYLFYYINIFLYNDNRTLKIFGLSLLTKWDGGRRMWTSAWKRIGTVVVMLTRQGLGWHC